jgi:hypothetical protein
MPFADIAADEKRRVEEHVGARSQLKLDTVQQLGELVAGDIERRLFSGNPLFRNDDSGSGFGELHYAATVPRVPALQA